MNEILIEKIEDLPEAVFEVIVKSDNETAHKVVLRKGYYKELTDGDITPEKLIKKSFEFLLSREPNTSILSEFNLRQISDYFPEYEDKIKSL